MIVELAPFYFAGVSVDDGGFAPPQQVVGIGHLRLSGWGALLCGGVTMDGPGVEWIYPVS